VAGVGDIDQDGFSDAVVGADGYTWTEEGEGGAFWFRGGSGGLEPVAAWTGVGGDEYADFGAAVLGVGDVTGDGLPDMAVGAPLLSGREMSEGAVALFRGTPTGPARGWSLRGFDGYTQLGGALGVADVDGCGVPDMIVGAPWTEDRAGAVHVLRGETGGDADGDGVPAGCDRCPSTPDPDQTDLDGDGVGDACQPCPPGAPDNDQDGVCAALDCDDADPTTWPGAPERCDGVKNDCDASGLRSDEEDADGDGWMGCGGDCADLDAEQHPGAADRCGLDQCDGYAPTCESPPASASAGCGCSGISAAPGLAALVLAAGAAARRRRAGPVARSRSAGAASAAQPSTMPASSTSS
jgi:uncharacterized protein (TIGR03382 family)